MNTDITASTVDKAPSTIAGITYPLLAQQNVARKDAIVARPVAMYVRTVRLTA